MTTSVSKREQVLERVERGDLIKICGLREPEHAVAAAQAGADLIGFIFAPARRQVTASTARACVDAARSVVAGRHVLAVGVFVDSSLSDIEGIVEAVGLDAVQLHGGESPEFVQSLRVPAFKAFRPSPEWTYERTIAEIDRYRSSAAPPVAFLIDGYSEHESGGTGARADWTLAAATSARSPIVLAGGLDSESVRDAIGHVRPHGVDVSSGVEKNGIKDSALITQFVETARAAFLDQVGQRSQSRVP